MKQHGLLALALVGALLGGGCASVPRDVPLVDREDRWERFNRAMLRFNDGADKIFRPIAKGYKKIMPKPLYKGLNNAFGNLGDIGDMVNNLLQGKIKDGLRDFARVLVNTTLGLGGLFDPAARMGLQDHDEDFGQTLARWGVPPGPFVVLPFAGPTTLRGAFALPVNSAVDPSFYLSPTAHRNTLNGVRLVHFRAELLTAEQAIFGDRYIFIRDAYLQRRDYLINDGEVAEDPFGDDF